MFFSRLFNKLWYIPTIEYHLMLKINEPSSHKYTWKNPKCILLNERIQFQKVTYVPCNSNTMKSWKK